MKFENTSVSNFEGAIRGMRNPMNSWNKSDSFFGIVRRENDEMLKLVIKNWIENFPNLNEEKIDLNLVTNGYLKESDDSSASEVALIGPNDMSLAQRLIKAGPEHRKFLRQIFVSVDITAPIYWY